MRTLTAAVFVWASLGLFALAKEENGLRVEVAKSTIENNDERRETFAANLDRTMGLKVQIKNTSMKPFEAGELRWVLIVERWSLSTARYERYSGTQKLDPLKPGQDVLITVGKAPLTGYTGYGKQYQDKVEAWKVTVLDQGADRLSMTSGSTFDRANAKAKEPSPSESGN